MTDKNIYFIANSILTKDFKRKQPGGISAYQDIYIYTIWITITRTVQMHLATYYTLYYVLKVLCILI